MFKFLLGSIFLTISGILYCCIHCSTTYDKEIDDIEQEKFIQEWKKDNRM